MPPHAPQGAFGGDDAPSPLLATYLREIARHPLLTREEELAVARAYVSTRDPRLEARLLTANLRLVVKMAGEYRLQRPALLDLVQEGSLGLLEAIRRFDPERGVRLPSYAGWWIRAYMLRYLMDNARLVRTGRTRAQRAQFFSGSLPPADVFLGDALDEPSGGVGAALQEEERPDLLVEGLDEQRFVTRRIRAFGEALDARESFVFSRRLLAEEPESLRTLGSALEMTGERVRQIEKSLVARFRSFVQADAAA